MTTNAFIFVWDDNGIEAIHPISQYEDFDKQEVWKALNTTDKEYRAEQSPVVSILRNATLRARYNSHRNYKIYAIDCDEEFDEKFWSQMWDEVPDECAKLITSKGLKIHD